MQKLSPIQQALFSAFSAVDVLEKAASLLPLNSPVRKEATEVARHLFRDAMALDELSQHVGEV